MASAKVSALRTTELQNRFVCLPSHNARAARAEEDQPIADRQSLDFSSEPDRSARPLSVLIVNSFYTPFMVGGAEVVAEMLATTLVAQGHRVSVITSCSRDEDFSVETLKGVEVYRFFPENLWWLQERFVPGDQRSAIDKIRWRVKDAWNSSAGERFGQLLDRIQPDVVHTHNIKGFSPAIWQAARRRAIPIVHTAHSYELICAEGSLLSRSGKVCAPTSRCAVCTVHAAWYRRQANAIDVFCSPSNYLLRAHAEAGVALKRCEHIRNGMRQGTFSTSPPLTDQRPVRYLYMGQLAPHKGIDTLIHAIGHAQASPFTIDIAGRGDQEGKLEALAKKDERVCYRGFVEGESKSHLLSTTDALIFPSIWVENSPMSIAEAFCYGVPVIGSNIGAIPELVEHGTNGLLFDTGNATSLADCMDRLSRRPDELGHLKLGASQSGRSWPTPETMASEYLSVYRSVLPR